VQATKQESDTQQIFGRDRWYIEFASGLFIFGDWQNWLLKSWKADFFSSGLKVLATRQSCFPRSKRWPAELCSTREIAKKDQEKLEHTT
jgi:hypothetical protein